MQITNTIFSITVSGPPTESLSKSPRRGKNINGPRQTRMLFLFYYHFDMRFICQSEFRLARGSDGGSYFQRTGKRIN